MQNVKQDIVIVGLGNPGARYQDTFHNIGFKVVDRLKIALGACWKQEGPFKTEVAIGTRLLTTFHLLKPQTFMNLSGEAVKSYLKENGFNARNLLVVFDDANLELGDMRLKDLRGTGGHNGLKSISFHIPLLSYRQLHMGIGRPGIDGVSLADFVLTPQPLEVWQRLEPVMKAATLLIESLAENRF